MRLMIDTDIILDVLMPQEPFYQGSKAVLELCENKTVQGYLPASGVTDIYHLIHRRLHNPELAYLALGHILEIAKVLTVTNKDVQNACLQRAPDFEDCLLAVCAKANRCEAIVTRNPEDYHGFGLPLFSPEELLARFSK